VSVVLWRAVAVFRVAALGYAGLIVWQNHRNYAHPGVGLAVLAVMAAWTVVTVAAYSRPRGRLSLLLAADVVVTAVLVLLTLYVETPARIDAGVPTLPVAWAAACVLACAVAGGPWAGGVAAVVIGAVDIVERGDLTQATFNGVVLLLLAGVVGGYVVRLGARAEAAVERAAGLEAATAERERLARGIHDSVLQVLALVQRRGAELGGEAAELGRLAGEQEIALRTLVASPPPSLDGGGVDHQVDLRGLLTPLRTATVEVAVPAGAVPLPAPVAGALAAAVGEALTNVRRHAGPEARAWVLVDDEGDAVSVSVRDDGSGFPPERLVQAASAGRLGVAQSILGRVRDCGGEATVTSAPGGGTEVELRVPR
jgi:signal transduction histidine kinase